VATAAAAIRCNDRSATAECFFAGKRDADCSPGNCTAMPKGQGCGPIGRRFTVHRYVAAAVAIASMIGMGAAAHAQDRQAPATTVRSLVLTAEPTKTFGEYSRVQAPVLQSGDHIHLYSEPGDFGWHSKDNDASFNVVAAVEVRARNGRITGKAEPRVMQYVSATRPDKFFFSLSVRIAGGVGAYELGVRLRDVVSGRVVERVFPFVVANKRQEPMVSGTTKAPAEVAKSAASGERARPADCKRYFPQLGEMISVECAAQ
jgi:hypothetical protein